ncbi:Peptide deformylase [subsurface metagenome]
MVVTMRKTKGVGLAAPQIGILRRLIVVDIGEGVLKLANPEIVESTGRDLMEEGCLSVPGESIEIARATKIVVKGLNAKGEAVIFNAEGLLARVIQHEIDHLNGKLIIDHEGTSSGKGSVSTQM